MSSPAPGFDCRATAALLRSMGTLVWASHLAALVAAMNHAWWALAGWGLVIYFAVRVRLDAELLDLLASDPNNAPGQLDEWLSRARSDRSIADRCRGARKLARNLTIALLAQVAFTGWFLWRSTL